MIHGSGSSAAFGVLAFGVLAFGVMVTAVSLVPPAAAERPASRITPEITVTPALAIPSIPIPPSLQPMAASPVPTVALTGLLEGPMDGYRIQVPRLGIDLPVQEGDLIRDVELQRTPEGYAFHLPGTAIPGRNGNTFLYAHARPGMFLALWDARPGDEVIVRMPTGLVLTYIVRDVLPRVAPTDVSSTRSTVSETLTLQTSTGPSAGDPRFVVVAFPRGK